MLTIYVRHTKACLPTLLAKGLSVEKQRAYKHCSCPKWYSGTHDGKRHPRTTLNANSWESAEKALAKIKEGDQPKMGGVTVEKAIEAWLEEVTLNGVTAETVTKYKIIITKLLGFCERQKLRGVQTLDATMINRWRSEWPREQTRMNSEPGLQISTTRNRITVLKLFFKFVRRRGWISETPFSMIQIAKIKEEEEAHQTLPLDVEGGEKEYRALLAAIPEYRMSLRRKLRLGAFTTRPQHLVTITELMYETGLRISDALRFQLSNMIVGADGWGTYSAKQKKTRRKVVAAIPPELATSLQKLSPISSRFLFWDERTKFQTVYTQIWTLLGKAGKRAGIEDMRPHRLRDSFAVNRLNEGMPIQDVSKLLGHTSVTTTEKYYAPFVKSRQDALMAKRKDLHGVTPARAKVLPIRKRA